MARDGLNKKKLILMQALFLIIFTACSSDNSARVTIEEIRQGEMTVNCSGEINKGKKQGNSLGYLCTIRILDSTILKDDTGNDISLKDFSKGDLVQIVLAGKQKISEKHRNVEAAEVHLIRK
jgi:hypothetical protein